MVMSAAGRVVRTVWRRLPQHFPHMGSSEYIVMPNHFHAIILLDAPDSIKGEKDPGEHEDQGEHKVRPYGTRPGSVGHIVQAFKSLTTNAYIRAVRENAWPPFAGRLWQRNYYERVIRDDRELAQARQYISDNLAKWATDRENPLNRRSGLERRGMTYFVAGVCIMRGYRGEGGHSGTYCSCANV